MSRFLFAFYFLLAATFSLIPLSSALAVTGTADLDGDGNLNQGDIDVGVANIEGLPQEDFGLDGDVNADDLNNVWKTAFGVNAAADANGDALSNGYDALAWQRHFGERRTVRGDAGGDGIVCDSSLSTLCGTTAGTQFIDDDRAIWQANLGQIGFANPADFDDDGDVDGDDETFLSRNHFQFLIANSVLDVDGNSKFTQQDVDLAASIIGLPSKAVPFFPSADQAITSEVALSLDLVFNTPGDSNSGGTWTVVGKASLAGLSGASLALSGVQFDTGTGFLGPASFEVEEAADFGTHLDVVLMDDMEDVVNNVGVVTSVYLDDPALVPLGGEPDLGSFDGGVLLATGSFLPGSVPDWFDDGSTSTLSNLFTGNTITFNRTGGGAAEVNLATTLLTVRAVNIPEPGSAVLLLISACSILAWRERS